MAMQIPDGWDVDGYRERLVHWCGHGVEIELYREQYGAAGRIDALPCLAHECDADSETAHDRGYRLGYQHAMEKARRDRAATIHGLRVWTCGCGMEVHGARTPSGKCATCDPEAYGLAPRVVAAGGSGGDDLDAGGGGGPGGIGIIKQVSAAAKPTGPALDQFGDLMGIKRMGAEGDEGYRARMEAEMKRGCRIVESREDVRDLVVEVCQEVGVQPPFGVDVFDGEIAGAPPTTLVRFVEIMGASDAQIGEVRTRVRGRVGGLVHVELDHWGTFVERERCGDCKGSGEYVGAIERRDCPTCGGSGWAK